MGDGKFDLITFGEIMLRLSPPNYELMTRGDVFDKRAGGSELNVASGVSLLGLRTGVISRLPANALGTYIKNRVRFIGVSDDYLIYDDSPQARLGIYYYENGAAPRKPSIVYDRMNSSITRISLDEIPESVYTNTRMFHTSGITLALNENTRDVSCEMIKRRFLLTATTEPISGARRMPGTPSRAFCPMSTFSSYLRRHRAA